MLPSVPLLTFIELVISSGFLDMTADMLVVVMFSARAFKVSFSANVGTNRVPV